MSFPENSLSHTPILDIFKNSQKLWFWMSFPRISLSHAPKFQNRPFHRFWMSFPEKHSESHPDFLASFNFELKYFYRVPQQV